VWLRNLARPKSEALLDRVAWWGTAAFLVLAAGAVLLVWALSDRWWPATVFLFGPRWVVLLPLVPLLPLAAYRDRVLLLPLAMTGMVVLGPVMGYRTGWRTLLSSDPDTGAFSVVTFNAKGGGDLLRSPANLLADWGADIVAIQECGPRMARALARIAGWHADARSNLCLMSRFPVLDVAEMEREALQAAGGAGVVVTYLLDTDPEPIRFTNLHLDTPRAGFELIRSGRIEEGSLKTREKSLLRRVELRRARAWTDRFQGPQIVVGDFNTTPESRSFREAWDGWQNAFSVAGSGLGGTRLNGWIRARIDHILASQEWKVLEAAVGADVGSDHLPLTARLTRR